MTLKGSEEKKTVVSEDAKEARELTPDELEKVTGGDTHLGTNTDVDRSTIKKEIDALIQQIDNTYLEVVLRKNTKISKKARRTGL